MKIHSSYFFQAAPRPDLEDLPSALIFEATSLKSYKEKSQHLEFYCII